MSDIALLEKRRELVELSADLQRATLSRRLATIDTRPSRAILGLLAAVGTPGVRRMAFALVAIAFRAWRRRRAARH